MAKKYVIYGFSYVNDDKGMNTLNGTKGKEWEEVYEEYNIACFNGIAYFKSPAGCFIMSYPKFNELSWEDKGEVKRNNGYIPEAGEYGAICSTFGNVQQISDKEFEKISREFPIKKYDYCFFEWLNDNVK